jgi:hypothetical protein
MKHVMHVLSIMQLLLHLSEEPERHFRYVWHWPPLKLLLIQFGPKHFAYESLQAFSIHFVYVSTPVHDAPLPIAVIIPHAPDATSLIEVPLPLVVPPLFEPPLPPLVPDLPPLPLPLPIPLPLLPPLVLLDESSSPQPIAESPKPRIRANPKRRIFMFLPPIPSS